MIRIASAQGFWGDWPQAPAMQLRSGEIDYLVFDYLAEVTMSIMQKLRMRDPSKGYATDFVTTVEDILPDLLDRKVRIISNAGGVNPLGCAEAIIEVAKRVVPGRELKVGVVYGDDILENVQQLPLKELDPQAPKLSDLKDKLIAANVYFGARPIVAMLEEECDIIVTGRVTDTGLTLAPMMHHFGVKWDDWDALATGIVAGHILECGAQSSGGNFLGRPLAIDELEQIGFPIAEFHSPTEFYVTKHESLGGCVTTQTVKEQLLYEIGDPKDYITPDVVVDFSTIKATASGENRVAVSGVKGDPATDSYKVSCAYQDGYIMNATLVYAWPDAAKKAADAGEIARRRAEHLGLRLTDFRVDVVGAGACHMGAHTAAEGNPVEVTLRLTARSDHKADLARLGQEVVPLVLTGPSGATGFAGGRPRPSDVLAYWPGLLDKDAVTPKTRIFSSTNTPEAATT